MVGQLPERVQPCQPGRRVVYRRFRCQQQHGQVEARADVTVAGGALVPLGSASGQCRITGLAVLGTLQQQCGVVELRIHHTGPGGGL